MNVEQPTTKREKVYKLIDGEREYQEDMPQHTDKERQKNTSVAAWIIYMDKLIQEAKERIYFMDENGALEFVRKTTAVGVACMEYNSTLPRKNPYRQGQKNDRTE